MTNAGNRAKGKLEELTGKAKARARLKRLDEGGREAKVHVPLATPP
jgi:hypothetical protein